MSQDQLNILFERVEEALRKLSPSGSVPDFEFGPFQDGLPADNFIFTNTNFFFESKSHAKEYLEGLDKAAQSIAILRNFLSRMSEIQKRGVDGYWFSREDDIPEELSVGKIAALQGISGSLQSALEFFGPALQDHREQACEEIKKYWSGVGRSKSWRARYVALRIAQMYYDENEEAPTFGVDYDGNPSTLYASVVSEVFGILNYDVNFKEPAKWARNTFIKQLDKGEIPRPGHIKRRKTVMETFTESARLVEKVEGIIGASIVYEPGYYPDMPENDEK